MQICRKDTLVPAIIPFTERTLWRKVADGTFPRPVKLGARATGFRVEDVRAWMESRT